MLGTCPSLEYPNTILKLTEAQIFTLVSLDAYIKGLPT